MFQNRCLSKNRLATILFEIVEQQNDKKWETFTHLTAEGNLLSCLRARPRRGEGRVRVRTLGAEGSTPPWFLAPPNGASAANVVRLEVYCDEVRRDAS